MALKDVLPGLRRERGLTQEQLAKRLYITRQAVSRWETGETTPGRRARCGARRRAGGA